MRGTVERGSLLGLRLLHVSTRRFGSILEVQIT